MTRFARIVVPGWVHHVTQRGNHRQTVFFSDNDRQVYLGLLTRHFTAYQLALIGYCLMDNHSHLVVIPEKKNSLANGVGRMHRDFARWQNVQCNRSGHLWQNRFFSCPVEEDRVWQVLRYVELNPVRAGLVKKPWDWPWSSARSHVTGVDHGLLDLSLWRKYYTGDLWKEYLEAAAAEKPMEGLIRIATTTGRPFSNDETAQQLESQLGRPLRAKKQGRKPRSLFEGAKMGK